MIGNTHDANEVSEHWWLLHAAAAGPGSLRGLAEALAAPGRVIDCPGFEYAGDEPAPPRAYARTLVSLLESGRRENSADRVRRVVFGHSMGGLAALLAALSSEAPDVLVLYEPIVVGLLRDDDPADQEARHWDADIIERLEAGVAAGDPETGVRAFVEAWNEVRWESLPAPVRARLTATGTALAREAVAASTLPLSIADLEGLRIPVIVLQGTTSPPLTGRMSARLCDALPQAHCHVIEGTGHMAPVLEPERVAGALAGGLRTLQCDC